MGSGLATSGVSQLCRRRAQARERTRKMKPVRPPSITFELMSACPELRPTQRKASLAEYMGKPTVLHLYTG